MQVKEELVSKKPMRKSESVIAVAMNSCYEEDAS